MQQQTAFRCFGAWANKNVVQKECLFGHMPAHTSLSVPSTGQANVVN